MGKSIKTSVIIPIYNTEKYLDQCIQSVLNQTQKEIEIILVNDGSTDNSGKIIDQYAKEYDNIIVVHQCNQKLGAARNNGYRRAKGEFVYFLDSDDFIAEDMLEKCYSHARKENLDFLFFDARAFYEDSDESMDSIDDVYNRTNKGIDVGAMNGKEYWIKYYKCGGIHTCAQFTYIRREYIKEHDLFFEKDIFYEDVDWIVRMYKNAERVSYFPHRLYYRRLRKGSIIYSNFSIIHLNSTLISLGKLISLYESYLDKESKQMAVDMIYPILSNLDIILENIDKNLINGDLIRGLHELLKKEKAFDSIDKKLYIKIMHAIEICIKILDKKSIEYKNIEDIYANHQKKFSEFIRNSYKLEEPINIGIYGTGKMCEEIFKWYEKKNIAINANINFIVTKADFVTYKGYPVYEIEQLSGVEYDYIIIASTTFAEEMLENLKIKNVMAKAYFKTYGYLNHFLDVDNKS